jgi:DNA-binding response OmpR family regulator
MRALIADDDRGTAAIAATALQPSGLDIVLAHDGGAAWDILASDEPPAIAVLDWMMPVVDGLELCRRLRQDEARAHTYVILLTSRDARHDVVAGLEAGADDYLVKPFDLDELRARVQVGIRMVALQESLSARIVELQDAMSKVKQLSGLLPICSYCKRIRGDENYWEQVESFIAEHSDAQFSHGICPACYKTVSAEFDQ